MQGYYNRTLQMGRFNWPLNLPKNDIVVVLHSYFVSVILTRPAFVAVPSKQVAIGCQHNRHGGPLLVTISVERPGREPVGGTPPAPHPAACVGIGLPKTQPVNQLREKLRGGIRLTLEDLGVFKTTCRSTINPFSPSLFINMLILPTLFTQNKLFGNGTKANDHAQHFIKMKTKFSQPIYKETIRRRFRRIQQYITWDILWRIWG